MSVRKVIKYTPMEDDYIVVGRGNSSKYKRP